MTQELDQLGQRIQFENYLNIIHHVIPFDVATVMIHVDEKLIPLATSGIKLSDLKKYYDIKANPRLDIIANSDGPIKFPFDSKLPEPFEAVFTQIKKEKIHSCMGFPLKVDGHLVGITTFDSKAPEAFDNINEDALSLISNFSSVILNFSSTIDILKSKIQKQNLITKDYQQGLSNKMGTEVIGTSPIILKMLDEIKLIAKSTQTVLIRGEIGTGKELMSKKIHEFSNRNLIPPIYINCLSYDSKNIEREIFGDQETVGKLEMADGGTIVLDEITSLPKSAQLRLYHFLQSGINKERKLDCRVISITNRNLEQYLEQGLIESELFHYLNMFTIKIPNLDQHKEDIPIYIDHFAQKISKQIGETHFVFTDDAKELMTSLKWPGNVKELINGIYKIVVIKNKKVVPTKLSKASISSIDLLEIFNWKKDSTISCDEVIDSYLLANQNINYRELVDQFQKDVIISMLKKHNGNWSQAAHELKINRSNLFNLGKRLEVKFEK